MSKRIIFALYKKEIRDILRDKKTMLMMIVMPLILYPLMFIGSMWIATNMLTSSSRETFHIGFCNVENAASLEDFFAQKEQDYNYTFAFVTSIEENTEANTATNTEENIATNTEENTETNTEANSLEDGAGKETAEEKMASTAATDQEELYYAKALREGKIDAYVSEETVMEDGKEKKNYIITYYSSENNSSTAAGMIEDMLKEYRSSLQIQQIEMLGLDADSILEPITYEYKDTASQEETVGSMFGYIIPFLLIVSILMGAMYPAIDTTAGEKERGTLETLLTMPVNNLELITSKFLATSTVAVFAAFLNVISMAILGGYFYSTISASAQSKVSFDIMSYVPAVLIMLLCSIVFSLFSSAVCLCVCIFAKSFKEAQNYTTPVVLVFMLAAMVCMIPQAELGSGLEFVPVVNITLLIGEVFNFKFVWNHILMVMFSNVVYSIFAIFLMTKMFRSEEILFGENASGIHLLESRRDMKAKQIPGIGDIILLFSILLLVVLMAGSAMIVQWGIWGLVAEQLLILGITLGYAAYIKVDWKRVFRLNKPDGWNLMICILCWIGAFLLMTLLSAVLAYIFPESAQNVDETYLQLWENVPFWLILASSAILPAICEEFAFRGFLFGTLSNRYRIGTAIIWTGLLFGLYHMSLVKLLVVGPLGALLAYIAYKTKSIWSGILVHCCNNAISILLSEKQEQMSRLFPALYQDNISISVLIGMLVFGIVLLVTGILLLKMRAGDFKKRNDITG